MINTHRVVRRQPVRLPPAVGVSLVLVASLVAGTLGCRSNADAQAQQATAKLTPPGEVPVNGFVVAWKAPLELSRESEVNHLYLRNDTLFVYTTVNRVYALSAAGGQILWGAKVANDKDTLEPPTVVKDVTMIPTSATIERYQGGKRLASISLGQAIRSPMTSDGNVAYVGLDYKNGGRLAKVDVSKNVGNTLWELMTRGGISSAPVLYEKIVYAASEDGGVHAVNEERVAAWGLDDSTFKTDGRITADLKVDEFGLYVASADSKLYCLQRGTGHIIWQYYAGAPLYATPAVTADSVYQAVPGEGVAAIDKTTGQFNRPARWVVPGTVQFLCEDGTNVYLRRKNNSIVGVDKKTGEVRGQSNRRDLTVFVSNVKTPLVYAATRNGTVVCARPVLKPGVVGEVVLNEQPPPAAATVADAGR